MEVELIDVMGNDERVASAARVSMHKEASNYPKEQNDKLIKYLATHDHFTPFTHCMITVREKVPIFIARQRFKHTVGFNYSEVSRRYVDDTPEFFIPDVWRKRADNVKQGSSENETVEFLSTDGDNRIKQHIRDQYIHFLGYAESLYDDMLTAGVAPEQARMILPQSMLTEYVVTGSLAAWARAYRLRSDQHAQKEIRDLAVKWDEIIRPLFPVAWSALVGELS